MTSLGIVQKPVCLHQHSRYQWNFYFFCSNLSTHLAPFHRLQTCLGFLLLLPLLMVVYQIQPPNVIELQQHSPLSNNTSVTTFVHRMIISPPCLLKHMKNDERFTMLFQCLLDHTQHKLYFCLISLLRNNVSNSVYINLRHSYINYYFMGGWPGDRSEELMSRAHSPIFPSLHLRHSSFSNSSGALPTSQLILQPFRRFTYVTAHSPTLPLLHCVTVHSPTFLSLLLRHRLSTYVIWRAAHAPVINIVSATSE